MSSEWDEVWLCRHHATSGYRAGEYEVCTPTGRTGGTLRYAVYGFKAYLEDALQFGALKEGMAARSIWHGACVKTGTWSTTSHNSIAGGTAAYSKEPGATISGDATGHALVLRTVRSTNGGMGIVSIDGDPYAADRLEEVRPDDFRAIAAIDANGAGEAVIACEGHGFADGAVISIEGASGTTGVDGRQEVRLIDADSFECAGSVLGGVYTGGATCGYFLAADLGKRYCDFFGSGAVFWDEQSPLAEGLDLGVHNVSVEALGTGRGGGLSAGGRIYATAILACGEAKMGDVDATMAYLDEAFNHRLGASFSSFGSAVEFAPEGGSYQFLGESHGYAAVLDATWRVDGRRASLAAGTRLGGQEVRLERSVLLAHPEGSGATAEARATFVAMAGERTGLRLRQQWEWREPGSLRTAYQGMLPVGVRPARQTALEQKLFETVEIGDRRFGLTPRTERNLGEFPAERIRFVDERRGARAEAILYDPDATTDGWERSGGGFAFVWQRDDGIDKAYFTRVGTEHSQVIAGGEIEQHDVGWHVWRKPEVGSVLQVRWAEIDGGSGERAIVGRGSFVEAAPGQSVQLIARLEDSHGDGRLADVLAISHLELSLSQADAARGGRGATIATRLLSARESMTPQAWLDQRTGRRFNVRVAMDGSWTAGACAGDYLLRLAATPRDGAAATLEAGLRVTG